jgi:hypothetical protein
VLDENRLAAATILCPGDLAGVCGFLIRGRQNNSQFIKALMKAQIKKQLRVVFRISIQSDL